jgi:hypothetical protein
MTDLPEKSAQARYSSLEGARSAVLDRARECARLTIPTLLPPSGTNESSTLPTPYQGIGARGVNNLASKLLLTLLPPNTPFFRLALDDQTVRELGQADEKTRGEVEDVFSSLERTVMNEVESSHMRVPTFEALKHLIVAGNVLLYLPTDGGMRTFALDRYVSVRDPMGTPVEVIVKETVSPASLPPNLIELAAEGSDGDQQKAQGEKTIDIYTHLRRDARRQKWVIYQEMKGKVIPGSQGTYPLDACPWMPLRLIRVDGESYGRGYVEEYLGDLRSLEGLSQAIVEGSAAAAKVLFLVKPNGTTRAKTLSKAPNGAIVEGNAEDVSTLGLDKFNDFRVALDTMGRIEKRLEYAFLVTSSIQRDAERVTAEEVRRMAQDLETALGGVYALLTQEFQLPLVSILMKRLTKAGRFPRLPAGRVRPTIVAGMEALGRGNDLANLTGLLADLAPFMEFLKDRLDMGEVVKRMAAARGVPLRGLLLPAPTPEQQQQAQLQGVMQEAAPGVLNTLAKGVMQGAPMPTMEGANGPPQATGP